MLCQLDLLISIKIQNVFHFSLLWKALNDPLSDQYNVFAPSIIIDDKKKWEVNDILNIRKIEGKKIEKKAAGKAARKVGKKIQFYVK